MGIKNWLNAFSERSQQRHDAMLAELDAKIAKSTASIEAARQEFFDSAERSRMSNRGVVPDDVVDAQIAQYKRILGE